MFRYPFRLGQAASSTRPLGHCSSTVPARLARATQNTLLLAGRNPVAPPPDVRSSSQPSPVGAASFPYLQPVPFTAWLHGSGSPSDELPVEAEGDFRDVEVFDVAAGVSHSLIAYRAWSRKISGIVERVLACGNNDLGQLGIGYASQEPTRGLVEGFAGDVIQDTACTASGSILRIREGDRTSLFATGSHSRGQLGLRAPPQDDAGASSRDQTVARSVALSAQATPVPLPASISITQLATGFEHALALTEDGTVLATGCNTDGQLGVGDLVDRHIFVSVPLPSEVHSSFGGVARVLAGGDTSGILTTSGHIYTWGNSEYCQAMHGKKVDQLPTPMQIDTSFLSPQASIIDVALSGSFSLLLDDLGNVYSTGYGPLGLGPSKLSSARPQRLPSLHSIHMIYAGPGYAAAASVSGDLFVWGLDDEHGRLGIGGSSGIAEAKRIRHVPEPVRVLAGDQDGSPTSITRIALGKQSMWVIRRSRRPEAQ